MAQEKSEKWAGIAIKTSGNIAPPYA